MRWGVPIAAVAVVGAAVGAGPVIAAAQGDPALPDRTAEQLLTDLAKAARDTAPPAMSGTVVETASLGLPSLPIPGGSSSSPLSLLSGSHTLKVWYGGDGRMRLALPGPMSETDVIATGKGEAWVWRSDTNTATAYTLKQGTPADRRPAHPTPPGATTPADVAAKVLEAADASTSVAVENGQHIAGRAAYQIVLTPKDSSSLVKEVKVALDGENHIPLRVQVFAKGAAEPAFEVGFTQVSFSAPAEENFAFTPPAGAKVERKTLGEEDAGGPFGAGKTPGQEAMEKNAGKVRTFGTGWATVAEVPFSLTDLSKPATGERRDRGSGDPAQVIDSLLKSAKQVSGPWGSGRVIQSKLVSALVTDDGRLLVGAVTPEALAEAAGHK
ncbi:LolA family protein [Sphaerisporangium corydalis]|uniref:Outer membrane lipoprotein carrier protein LolA n=1 Tax=Sphaerisporangium corydalis TaxID=1441875 RepID=A0ABV9EAZ3_9ACTN|nr:DUF2092 domain-containing protein [Sphaerisporangium corydalis]